MEPDPLTAARPHTAPRCSTPEATRNPEGALDVGFGPRPNSSHVEHSPPASHPQENATHMGSAAGPLETPKQPRQLLKRDCIIDTQDRENTPAEKKSRRFAQNSNHAETTPAAAQLTAAAAVKAKVEQNSNTNQFLNQLYSDSNDCNQENELEFAGSAAQALETRRSSGGDTNSDSLVELKDMPARLEKVSKDNENSIIDILLDINFLVGGPATLWLCDWTKGVYASNSEELIDELWKVIESAKECVLADAINEVEDYIAQYKKKIEVGLRNLSCLVCRPRVNGDAVKNSPAKNLLPILQNRVRPEPQKIDKV